MFEVNSADFAEFIWESKLSLLRGEEDRILYAYLKVGQWHDKLRRG